MLVKVEGHRWAIEDSFETAKNELGLDDNGEQTPLLAWLASPRLARHARLRHDGRHPASRKHHDAPKKNAQDGEHISPPLIRWSVQEIRRIAVRLARRRIQPAYIIAWSLWRRAHQASARS